MEIVSRHISVIGWTWVSWSILVIDEHMRHCPITLLKNYKSTIYPIIDHGRSSEYRGPSLYLSCLLRHRPKVPKGHQESPSCPTNAAQSWVCFQPDGDGGKAGPGEADTGVRYVQVGRETVRVLIALYGWDIVFLYYTAHFYIISPALTRNFWLGGWV